MPTAEPSQDPVDYASAFALIADMAEGFAESGSVEATLLRTLTSITSLVGAEAGSLWVVDDARTTLTCEASVGPIPITGVRLALSEGIVGKSVRENLCQTVFDVALDPSFSPGVDQTSGMVTRSILCAPMSFSDEVIGAVELINKNGGNGRFSEGDAQLLRVLASSAGLAIRNQRLAAAQIEAERFRCEVELAAEIQASMLPRVFPPFPERDEFSLFATLRPAREVGGDFYNFLLVDEHRLCFYIGDVSGKGVASALFMAAATTLIKPIAQEGVSSPARIMARLNEELSRNNPSSMFVTIFLACLDLRTGELTYTNAGHNPPFRKCADGSVAPLVQRHGPAVGAMEGVAYGESTLLVSTGDLLFLYTDGVTEAKDPGERFFSEERLSDLLSSRSFATIDDAVRAAADAVAAFESGAPQTDDVAILAVRFEGRGSGTGRERVKIVARNQVSEIRRVQRAFDQFAEEHHIGHAAKPRIELALEELLQNIIGQAFEDDLLHTIDVEIGLCDRKIIVTLSDDGIPFDPFAATEPDTRASLEQREPGGLGIHLVKKMAHAVSYQRRADRNILQLVYRIDSP